MASFRASAKVFCKYHPDAELIEDSRAGDLICPECGLVVGDRVIDVSCEWRSFSNPDDGKTNRSRVGAAENPAFDGNNLSTVIGAAPVGGEAQSKYRSRQQLSASDRKMLNALRELESMAHHLAAPQSIVEAAAEIYRRIQLSGKVIGRSQDPIIAACMYIGCRNEGAARMFKDIAAASSAEKSDIIKMFHAIVKALGLSIEVASSEDLVNRFCSRLELDYKYVRVALNICQQCKEQNLLTGCKPSTVAAAAVYMAANGLGNVKSAASVGAAIGCAEDTVKKAQKNLMPYAKQLFPKDAEWNNVEKNLAKLNRRW